MITFHVTSSIDGGNLVGANVYFNAQGPTPTDANGNVSFPTPSPVTGAYMAAANYQGTVGVSATFTPVDGMTVPITIAVASGGGGGGTGSIQGTVTDANGGAISGAAVSIAGASVVATSSSSFSATNVPAGTHTISVIAPGFQSYTGQVVVVAGQTTQVAVVLTPVAGGGGGGAGSNTGMLILVGTAAAAVAALTLMSRSEPAKAK